MVQIRTFILRNGHLKINKLNSKQTNLKVKMYLEKNIIIESTRNFPLQQLI